jgi:hypothetical protein
MNGARRSKEAGCRAKTPLIVMLLVIAPGALVAGAQAPSQAGAADLAAQCDKLEAQKADLMKQKDGLLAEQKGLDQEDLDIKAQVKKLRDAKMDFKMDADALQDDIGKYNAKCGGTHTRTVYESLRPTCEPWGKKIDDKNADLEKRGSQFAPTQRNIDTRQSNLSINTLALTRKINDNSSNVSAVTAQLDGLHVKTIQAALRDPLLRSKAASACKNLQSAESQHCCNSVVFDGTDPHQCGVPLIFEVFKTGGAFGTAVVRPGR